MPLQMLSLVGEIDHSQYLSATKSGKLGDIKTQAQKDFPGFTNEITSTVIALNVAIKSLDTLDEWLKKTSGEMSISAISTQFLKTNMTDCLMAIKYLVGSSYSVWPLDQNDSQEESIAVENNIPNKSVESNDSAVQSKGHIQMEASSVTNIDLSGRDQAFQELRKIADYFSKSEPHSPVSFLLEKAIRWGYMPLPELMQELMNGNDKALSQVSLITGINSAKADISAHVPTKPARQVNLQTNSSTEPQISAINEPDSKTMPMSTPQMSLPEKKQKTETETSSQTDDFSF